MPINTVMSQTHVQLLQDMPIFGGVDKTSLEFIVLHSAQVEITKGAYFFQEGDLAQCMYVLERGRVGIYRLWEGEQYKLRELAVGDCFGEMSLMACSIRSASVKALQACSALSINANLFADLYKEFPEQFTLIQMNMGREVCRRLTEADTRLFQHDMRDTARE